MNRRYKRYRWNYKRFIGNMLALIAGILLISGINYMFIQAILGQP